MMKDIIYNFQDFEEDFCTKQNIFREKPGF